MDSFGRRLRHSSPEPQSLSEVSAVQYATIDLSASSGSSPDHEPSPRTTSTSEADGRDGEPESVSIHQLEQAVEAAKRDVRRIDALILRAIWQNLQHRHRTARTDGDASAGALPLPQSSVLSAPPSEPLSVDVRRAQLQQWWNREHSSVSFQGETSRPTHTTDVTSDSDHNPHRGGGGGQPPHLKPFLPPDRFPTLPPLDPAEHAGFNRLLFRAVSAARRSGRLQQGTLKERRQGPSRALSQRRRGERSTAAASSSSSLTTQMGKKRDQRELHVSGVSRPVSQHSTFSLRGSALRTVTRREVSGARRPGSVHNEDDVESDEEWTPPPIQSVSLLVLRVAKERALATVFLRQLRLDVYRRHAREREVELRFQYYRQRRVVRGWAALTTAESSRRTLLLRRVVSHWQSVVGRACRMRRGLAEFRNALHRRSAAFAQCRQSHLKHCFRRWQAVFTHHRVERSMYQVADAVRLRQRPRYIDVFAAHESEKGTIHPGTVRYAMYRVFAHWKTKTEHRLEASLANWAYQRSVLRRAFLRWHTSLPPRVLDETHTASPSITAVRTVLQEVPSVSDALPPARHLTVYVTRTAAAADLQPFKESCARRVGDSVLVQRAFRHWLHRFKNRVADRVCATRLRITALRYWLLHLARRQAQAITLRELWWRWRAAVRRHREHRVAVEMSERRGLCHAFRRWHAKLWEVRAKREEVLRDRLLQWRARAALRVATRVLTERRLQAAFQRWRHRAQVNLYVKTTAIAANTIRETVLVVDCFRFWRRRLERARRARLTARVWAELQEERQLRWCFARWHRRTRSTPPLTHRFGDGRISLEVKYGA